MLISLKNQKILVIAPHPDDEVIGCGGLIARAKREGGKVFVLYFTVGAAKDFSRKGSSTAGERILEMHRVARFLKIDGYRLVFPGDDYHLRLDAIPQREIINEIEQGKKISLESIRPTILLTCDPNDYNQDHRAASLATITAARPVPNTFKSLPRIVLTYEHSVGTWTTNAVPSAPNLYVGLSPRDLAAKLAALRLYRSQLKHPRGPFSPHAVATLAKLRGLQAGLDYAEAFSLKRLVT